MRFLRLFLSLTIVIAFLSKLMVVDFKFGNLFHKDHTQKYKLVCLNKTHTPHTSKLSLYKLEIHSPTETSPICDVFCTPSFILPEVSLELSLKNIAISNPNSKVQFFYQLDKIPHSPPPRYFS